MARAEYQDSELSRLIDCFQRQRSSAGPVEYQDCELSLTERRPVCLFPETAEQYAVCGVSGRPPDPMHSSLRQQPCLLPGLSGGTRHPQQLRGQILPLPTLQEARADPARGRGFFQKRQKPP